MARILIVDDDRFFRETIIKFLTTKGHEIVEAGDAAEALDKFDDSIELIMTDLVMPGVNGIELIKKIRAKSKIKILAMSGYGVFSPEPLQNSVKLAVDASYAKGEEIEKLLEAVDSLIDSKGKGTG